MRRGNREARGVLIWGKSCGNWVGMTDGLSGEVSNMPRVFHAMVTRAEDPGRADRVTVLAGDLMEARRMLVEAHGKENVFGVHDPDESEGLLL